MSNQEQDASVPGQFPSQDGVDRSDHVAVIMSINLATSVFQSEDFDWVRFPTVRPDYRDWVDQSLIELSSRHPELSKRSRFELEHYQVGPAAGGMIDNIQMVATVLGIASSAYGTVEFVRFVHSLSRKIKAKATRWASQQGFETLEVESAYPPIMLKHMAIGYLMEFYGYEPNSEVFIECLTREFFGGYTSPAHPTTNVEYLVIAPTATGSYRMQINGDSRIVFLRREERGRTRLLPTLPYLNDMEEDPNDPNIPQ